MDYNDSTNSPLNHSLNNSIQESLYSSSKKNRQLFSFQIVKCNKCQIQITKKDLAKHEDNEKLCKCFIESYFRLFDDKIDETIVKERSQLFENSFLLGDTILYTSSISSLQKEKLDNELKIKNDENVVFLSSELLQHCNLNNGDYVSIFDFNESIEKNYFIIQSCNSLKSCLSIGFLKDYFSSNRKNLSLKPNRILRVRLKITSCILKSLHVEIQKEFSDPIIYMNVCSNIRKHLLKKVIDPNEIVITVILNDIEYKLKINESVLVDNHQEQSSLETGFANLSICRGNSRIDSNCNKTHYLAYVVSEETKVIFSPLKFYHTDSKFVGYEKQCKLLRSLIIKPLENNECSSFQRSTNILLTGPTGTGKTLVMRTLLEELNGRMNIVVLPSAIFLSKSFEFDKMCQVLKNLINLKPSILFMDNLEDILNEKNKLDKRFVSWLKVFFDDLPRNEHIMVVGVTNRTDLFDNSLRRFGRFEIEIDFPIPTSEDRKLIFKEILNHFNNNLTAKQIDELAEAAHGFTGGDLQSLCKNHLLKENETNIQLKILKYENLVDLLSRTKPSSMLEINLETPNVRWSDIGGLHKLKHLLEECVVWPIKHPDAFVRLGIDPPKGILMYGPPGCCKTMIGKALANESGLNFFSIKGPELFSKWVGESERAIREIFRKARAASPSILFFDEIDALATERGQTQSVVGDRVLAQLLTEIDGIEKLSKVIIIAATNRPDIVDKALLRPGRLDSVVYVSLPDFETRREIFKIRLSKMPLSENIQFENFIEKLASMSVGYSGAEINAICQRAALLALGDNREADSIQKDYFIRAFDMVLPQTSVETIEFYEKFVSKYNVM